MNTTTKTPTAAEAVETRTLIDAAAEHIAAPKEMVSTQGPRHMDGDDSLKTIALPPGWSIETVDTAKLLPGPRRATGTAKMTDTPGIVDYLHRHADDASALWIDSDPASAHLQFVAVLDEHYPDAAGWREHRAIYTPRISQEWTTWKAANGKQMRQADFAGWIEDQLPDIAEGDGLPTGTQMLEMALNFEAKQDMRFKSAIRLQGGGVNMEYVSTDDNATIERMRVFDRFAIGIPVYWGGARFRMEARLRYRTAEGKLVFWFELIRPARVAEAAQLDLVKHMKEALTAASVTVPVYMGTM